MLTVKKHLVLYMGPVVIELKNRSCFTGVLVLGDEAPFRSRANGGYGYFNISVGTGVNRQSGKSEYCNVYSQNRELKAEYQSI